MSDDDDADDDDSSVLVWLKTKARLKTNFGSADVVAGLVTRRSQALGITVVSGTLVDEEHFSAAISSAVAPSLWITARGVWLTAGRQ